MSDEGLQREFLFECRENLEQLEHELLAFEGHGSPEMLDAIFRSAHTVKGNSGFFGHTTLQHLMHTTESLLSRVRDGELVLTSPVVSTLLDVVDAARELLNAVEATGHEGEVDCAPLIAALIGYGAELVAVYGAEPAHVPAIEPPEEDRPKIGASVRVDTALLDRLVDLAGELVLARNQLLELVGAAPPMVGAVQRLDTVTTELQETVMRTRMQPIALAWAKLPRVVRDLGHELGKQVQLELRGEETALDRTLLEAIRDPLTHLVRNAIDHGIELPAHRLAAGKPAQGVLSIVASHAGGHVAIEIRDDGAGVDVPRVRARAIERGLLTEERARRMSDHELVQIIFAPGFSTADGVTSVSGRGVGMDVVKTNVEAIGGTVAVSATSGVGTTVRITIPLTLAIMPTLLVSAGGRRYAIPESALLEILRIDPDLAAHEPTIEYLHGAAMYRRHGALIPLAVLDDALHGRSSQPIALPAFVVVVASTGGKLGLVVDELHDPEEIVVKPLARLVAGTRFLGATILGDGSVTLIVDVERVANDAGLCDRAPPPTIELPPAVATGAAMLVVRGRHGRAALRLDEVTRLEEFAIGAIERAGCREVVKYHGRLLPLIRIGDPRAERATVVVHSDGGRDLGLVVESIIDVYQGELAIDTMTAEPGILGSAVIAGHITNLLDLPALAAAANLRAP